MRKVFTSQKIDGKISLIKDISLAEQQKRSNQWGRKDGGHEKDCKVSSRNDEVPMPTAQLSQEKELAIDNYMNSKEPNQSMAKDRTGGEESQGGKKSQTMSRKARTRSSLFEDLFPDEVTRPKEEGGSKNTDKQDELEPLPPPEITDPEYNDDLGVEETRDSQHLQTRQSSVDSLRQKNVTVLVLSGASLSLTENDFLRIAPKGMHIEEWQGPGNVLTGT